MPSRAHHWGRPLTVCRLSERNRLPVAALERRPRAPSRRWLCLGAAPLREGRSGRLVWRANCPFETPIDSLTCFSNTVQNGSCREPQISLRPGFPCWGTPSPLRAVVFGCLRCLRLLRSEPSQRQLHERHAEVSGSVAIISIASEAELSSKEWKHLNPSRRFCRLPGVEYVDTCHPSLLRGAMLSEISGALANDPS
jgi:hypothetical protein